MNALVPVNAITPFRLPPGQRVTFGAHVYECVDKSAKAKKLIRVDTRAEVWVDNSKLIVMMTTGDLKLAPPANTPLCRAELQQKEFSSLPAAVRRRAYMRRDYCEALIENARLGYPRKTASVLQAVYNMRLKNFENADEWKPSESRAYYWKGIWEACHRKGIANLVMAESARSNRGLRNTQQELALLTKAIVQQYMTPQRQMVSKVHAAYVGLCTAAGLTDSIHDERTTRRAIKMLSPYAVTRARRGQRAADLAYRSVGKLEATALPGEVYEVDAHMLDIIIVDDDGFVLGRLWITTAIDRCTRMIVGFHLHLEPPSSLTIAACIRNAIAPKLYMLSKWPQIGHQWLCWGVPTLVIVDNGLENKAYFLIEAADEIGFAIHWAPPRTPEYKPYIERWHLTLTMGFERAIPGNTGSDPKDRGDYDTAGMACATLEDIDELLHQWVVTTYNRTPHRGINDVPERLWLELATQFEVAPFDDIERLDVLLGHLAYRKIHTYGIELLGLRYGDLGENHCLEMIRTRPGAADLGKVKIRFDPTDLSCIQVQDPETLRYYRVESLDPGYTTGMTLARHRVIRREAVERTRGYITVNELCLSRDRLQKRINEIIGDPHAPGRKKATILNGIGSKGSWGPFYRLAQDEYGLDRVTQMQSTIVELLSGEYHYVDEQAAPAASTAVATPRLPIAALAFAPAPEVPGPNTPVSTGTEPVGVVAPPTAQVLTQAALTTDEIGGLTAGAAQVGITVEGLDD